MKEITLRQKGIIVGIGVRLKSIVIIAPPIARATAMWLPKCNVSYIAILMTETVVLMGIWAKPNLTGRICHPHQASKFSKEITYFKD